MEKSMLTMCIKNMTSLLLKRIYLGESYTIGKLFINGVYFCDTLEDKVRDLNMEPKVYGKTAIPYGKYHVSMNAVSPKFRNRSWARPYGGRVPRLMNVPNFSGILIHPGNEEGDTLGCILVGENKVKGKVINSVNTFHRLMKELDGKTNVEIEIVRN